MPDLKDDIRSLIEGGIRPLDLSEIPRPLSRDERVLKGGSVPLFQNTGIRRKLSHRFSKSRHVVLGSVAAAVVILGVIGATVASRTAPTPLPHSWSLVGDISQPGWQMENSPTSSSESLVCTTASTCYVVGLSIHPVTPGSTPTFPETVVEVTHNGGVTWSPSVPAPGIELSSGPDSGLSCPATNTCMIAGAPASASATDHMYITTNGGQSWTSNPMPTESEGRIELSCTNATICVAVETSAGQGGVTVGSDAFSTTDGGQSWSTTQLPDDFTSFSLQCVTGGDCVVVGETTSGGPGAQSTATVLYSPDGGTSWSSGILPAGSSSYPLISDVSCADAMHCVAVEPLYLPNNSNSQLLVTDTGGMTWTTSTYTSPRPVILNDVSCSTDSDCWATGTEFDAGSTDQDIVGQGYIMATNDGGTAWTPESVPSDQGIVPNYVGSISCVAASVCSAIAQAPKPGEWILLSNQAM